MSRRCWARYLPLIGTGIVLYVAGSLLLGGSRHAAAQGDPAKPGTPAGTAAISFSRQVRPILSDHCYACHGPDRLKRKADLRLDQKDIAFGPLPKDPDRRAFVPGRPDQSEVYRRINSTDPNVRMPPPEAAFQLDDAQKATIGKWIEQGAHWEEHWAFIKPVRPALPPVKDQKWCRNEIDRFVLANLEQKGLSPSVEADRPMLVRRVTLDLTGLPPTPAEIDAFLADTSPGAYEKVVDRLLASPRYGERMATAWLDGARYADSHGFQSDPERHMWLWRDWVIKAFNGNMPFDEFTIEQLAGDLLPNATVDQKIATGFNRNHRINSEGGAIPEEWRVESVVDRVETTSAVFLGLTMGCARCHDHKYDPITQKEFYRFYAYFNSITEAGGVDPSILDKGVNAPPTLKVPTPAQQNGMDELNAKFAAAETHVKQLESRLPELRKQWEASGAKAIDPPGIFARFALDQNIEGTDASAKPIALSMQNGAAPAWIPGRYGKAIQFDGKAIGVDAGQAVHFDRSDAFSFGCWANVKANGTLISKMDDAPSFRGFDLTVLEDRVMVHLINEWPKNAIRVVTQNPLPKNAWVHVMATYDGSGKAAGVKIYFNGKLEPIQQPPTDALNATIIAQAPLLIGKRINSLPLTGAVHDVRFYSRALYAEEVESIASWPKVQSILQVEPGKRNAEQNKALDEYVRATMPDLPPAKLAFEQIRAQRDQLDAQIPDTMIMQDLPQPRPSWVLIRGQYDQHGEPVTPGLPSILPPLPNGAPNNRLGLALWIVDPSNPLTARVQANRLWDKFFGVGIVKSVENLGTQSEWPSNLELLDWLATEMFRLKWDLKAFQKEIVMSATYRQASNITPELLERDPDNRLLARGPRFRLPAETIRDQALAVSGLLVEKLGGPSVKPYQPQGVWDGNRFGNLATYVQDHGESLYRRSLYSFWKRTAAPPNMMIFDMPSREFCVVQRSRTNTPLQALSMMNEVTYLEASRVLAEHMIQRDGATPAQRIAWAFRLATGRLPKPDEATILLDGWHSHMSKYRAHPDAAKELINVGEAKRDEKLAPGELAAYTLTASVILNLDETITKQ